MNAVHPAWCRIDHEPGQLIQTAHAANVGEVVLSDTVSVSVELNDYGNGRGPVVTLATWAGGDQDIADLTPAQARYLAGLLATAATTLDHQAIDHAFRLGEPYPAGDLWVCLCGTRLLQRHSDTRDIGGRLRAHAAGDPSEQTCPSGCGLAAADCPEVAR